MKQALLIHGWNTKSEYYDQSRPTASNDHWFPWLTKQLMLRDIHTVSIEMPGYYPRYEEWKRELERYDIDEDTILVGHSCGGGFLVRWLSENDTKVGKVVLVGPWLGTDVSDEPFDDSFFNFKIKPDIAQQTKELVILYSLDDVQGIIESVQMIKDSTDGVRFVEFIDKGHFTISSLRGEAFPELLEELQGLKLYGSEQ